MYSSGGNLHHNKPLIVGQNLKTKSLGRPLLQQESVLPISCLLLIKFCCHLKTFPCFFITTSLIFLESLLLTSAGLFPKRAPYFRNSASAPRHRNSDFLSTRPQENSRPWRSAEVEGVAS